MRKHARPFAFALALGTLPLAAPSHAGSQPSFDCRRAGTWAERTICNDAALAASDREMSAAFARRRAAVDDAGRRALVAEQRRWLAGRDRCRGAEAPAVCLERMYHERIVALGGRPAPAPPPEIPATAAETPAPHPRSGGGAFAECHGSGGLGDGFCLDRLLAAATAAFGDAEAAMLKRLAGADGAPANPAAAEAFRTSQDAFLRFRDATCQWRGAAAGANGESVRQACLVDYTRARTAEITAALR